MSPTDTGMFNVLLWVSEDLGQYVDVGENRARLWSILLIPPSLLPPSLPPTKTVAVRKQPGRKQKPCNSTAQSSVLVGEIHGQGTTKILLVMPRSCEEILPNWISSLCGISHSMLQENTMTRYKVIGFNTLIRYKSHGCEG